MIATLVLAAALCAHSASPRQDAGQGDVAALLARIEQLRDDVSPEVIADLAELGTREAAEALIAGYDRLTTILMRREVLRALARFDGVPTAEQVALQALANAALGERAPELHTEAVDLLAACPSLGHAFLRLVVESPAASGVRERALLRHVETSDGSADDLLFYEHLFESPGPLPAPGQKAARESAGDALSARSLARIRERALEQIAPGMKDTRLLELAREKARDAAGPDLAGQRRVALAELVRRGSSKGRALAEDVFTDVTEPAENRIAAARHLHALEGPKVAARFLSEGDRDPSVVPLALRMELAEMLAELHDAGVEKKLLTLLKRSEGETTLFCLRALRGSDDERLQALLLDLLHDPAEQVRLAAVEALGASGRADALEPLEQLLALEQSLLVLVSAFAALTQLHVDDPEWSQRLVELTADERGELRNAALRFLADHDGAPHEALFSAALEHEDWSTRVTALEILTELRTRASTRAIVTRMSAESGYMLSRFAEALWTLSGQPFGRNVSTWQHWWTDVESSFEPISAEELAVRMADEERRRLLESTSAASFFGVRLESQRLLFVLDVSGSMDFPLRPATDDEPSEPRMVVAKREILAVLSGLRADTFFNLVTFSSGVEFWRREGIVAAMPGTVEEVCGYVTGLSPGGGTNLYGALQAAFSDRDVDTIYILSDGVPEGGEIDDPYIIRERVASWNEHRHVTLHTVAIGGKLDILAWLAEDSGGQYVQFE